MRHRPNGRHRRSGKRRVWTAEVLDIDGRGRTSAWPILEDSFSGSQEGKLALQRVTAPQGSGELQEEVFFYVRWLSKSTKKSATLFTLFSMTCTPPPQPYDKQLCNHFARCVY